MGIFSFFQQPSSRDCCYLEKFIKAYIGAIKDIGDRAIKSITIEKDAFYNVGRRPYLTLDMVLWTEQKIPEEGKKYYQYILDRGDTKETEKNREVDVVAWVLRERTLIFIQYYAKDTKEEQLLSDAQAIKTVLNMNGYNAEINFKEIHVCDSCKTIFDTISYDIFDAATKASISPICKNCYEYKNAEHAKMKRAIDTLVARATNGKAPYNPKADSDCVYVFKVENQPIYKIGISVSPEARLSSLLTSSPFNIEIVGYEKVDDAPELEKRLHKKYKEFRKNREWFELNDEQVSEILDIINSNRKAA